MLFEKREYKERLAKVKIAMQSKGIDLLVSHDPANMNYLTGYDAWSFYYAQCVLIHVNEDEPICFLRALDVGGAYIKTYVKDKNIINKSKCKSAIKKANKLMNKHGRLLIRKSGTEPKIRIMGESYNKKLILRCIKLIKRSIK